MVSSPSPPSSPPPAAATRMPNSHLRFLVPHLHLAPAFGEGWFGAKAEAFARFFGTPMFLIGQTVVVAAWIVANIAGWAKFDLYPFILLNLPGPWYKDFGAFKRCGRGARKPSCSRARPQRGSSDRRSVRRCRSGASWPSPPAATFLAIGRLAAGCDGSGASGPPGPLLR
jgi:hypothetical protein